MSFFDPKLHRFSKHHLSQTTTSRVSPKTENPETEFAPDDVSGRAVQQIQSFEGTQDRQISVAPIRSLSLRQQLLHPSTTSLCDSENCQELTDGPPRRSPSAKIPRTIRRIEDILGELDSVAIEAQDVFQPNKDPPAFRRASTRLLSDIRVRFPSLRFESPSNLPAIPRAALGSPDRHVTFSDDETPRNAAEHDHVPKGIRACEPVHFKKRLYKAAPAPATVTHPSQDIDMKLMRRRSQGDSRFHEHFKLNSPPAAALPSQEGYDVLPLKSTSQTRISMTRQNYLRRVKANQPPLILPRTSSMRVVSNEDIEPYMAPAGLPLDLQEEESDPLPGHERHYSQTFGLKSEHDSMEIAYKALATTPKIILRRQRHVDMHVNPLQFDLQDSCHHAPVARDWPVSRKRFAAVIACLNAACIGMVIGTYSGEVPAIQYVIVDFHHYAILGNVFLYCAMALPTLLLWPLPLLHGRKVYTVAGFALALCLQIPQAVAVSYYRSPDVASYRELLFISRALSGFAFGFVVINVQGTLLDCFGASLQSHNPHGEALDPYDVRRHGGGMGVWLGIWSFASLASISFGFMIGTFIVSTANVMWGFLTCFVVLLAALLLNIVIPEVRRSAYRRTLKEMRGQDGYFSRIARGEVKMHMESTGPYWWGEEVLAGIKLSCLMAKQPGFLVLAVYTAWVYAQFTMILMLLGALVSRYYFFIPIHVGLCVLSLTLGAIFAIPFEKASWLSRARYKPPRTDSMTMKKGIMWSSHMLRRLSCTVLLPLAALASCLTYKGPPLHVAIPCLFAAMVGFLSTLAIAECFGYLMETFDTSDLQPGMTGRPARRSAVARSGGQRTNFSCYPRVSASFAITQSLEFIFAATATGICGRLERKVGAMMAMGVVAAGLLFLTLLLTVVLARGKVVKMIPDQMTMTSPSDESNWEPVILGTPSGTTRKITILEAGRQTRWSEIRRRNRVDETGLTGS